jgi:hypothetical protein
MPLFNPGGGGAHPDLATHDALGLATDAEMTTHAGAADPHTGYQKESEKSAASGYASLSASTKVPIAELPTGTSSTTVSLGDHVHSLTTASAYTTAETTISAATYADITGASVSLAAGTWLVMAKVNGASQTTTVAVMMVALTHSDNTVISETSQHLVAGTATVRTWGNATLVAIVSPGSTTTYKLRGARGTTTQTGNWIASDGNGVNTANNVSNNTDKGTGIWAVRIA